MRSLLIHMRMLTMPLPALQRPRSSVELLMMKSLLVTLLLAGVVALAAAQQGPVSTPFIITGSPRSVAWSFETPVH